MGRSRDFRLNCEHNCTSFQRDPTLSVRNVKCPSQISDKGVVGLNTVARSRVYSGSAKRIGCIVLGIAFPAFRCRFRGSSMVWGDMMKGRLSKCVLFTGALLVWSVSAQMILTEDVQDHRSILEDWQDQDRVGQKGYGQAIEEILPTLSAEKVAPLQEKLDALGTPADSADLLSLYIEVCSARRAERMGPYLDRFKEVVYCAHETPGEVFRDIGRNPSGELRVLRMNGLFGKESRLFHDRRCRTPDVSYDGKRILFSSKAGEAKGFRLFEMNLVDSSVRQITHGYNDINFVADLEAIYLPNGNIMFTSSRMIQAVDCFGGVVYNPVS